MKRQAWRWIGLAALVAGGATVTTLRLQRARHLRALNQLWTHLARPGAAVTFAPEMAEDLPAPARRYLLRAIAPGTRIARAVELRMHGGMRLQRKGEPAPFTGEQIISEGGYIWRARVRSRAMQISGYDRFVNDEAELRWWLYDTFPVASAAGANVSRSAAGRLAGEFIFLPGALLPQRGAEWQAIDDSTALVRVTIGLEQVEVTVSVQENGRLRGLSINRWNSDAKNGAVGFLRFDVDEFAQERTFGGYTIPTQFRAGWRLGTREGFPFYYGSIDGARYL